MKVKSESEVAQSCPTLSNPMDCSLTGSSVHGIFHARVLEWSAIAFSVIMVYKVLNDVSLHYLLDLISFFLSHSSHTDLLSIPQTLHNPWTAAYQAPPSMGLSRQEYWSGLPLQQTLNIWKCYSYRSLGNLKFTTYRSLGAQKVKNPAAMQETWV